MLAPCMSVCLLCVMFSLTYVINHSWSLGTSFSKGLATQVGRSEFYTQNPCQNSQVEWLILEA